MRLEGKTVVITGGGSGVGRECALLFSQEGANIVVTDKIERRVEKVTQEVIDQGGKAIGMKVDVTVEADLEAACKRAVEEFGRLDIMLANAGVAPEGFGRIPIEDFTEEAWDAVNDVVYKGVFLSAKHAVRVMKGQGSGNIIVTSSASGFVAYPGMFAYSAGKGGANMLVRNLALEVGKYGIRANGFAPTHGGSINFALDPDADVVGRSYDEVRAEKTGGWDAASAPMPLKLQRPPSIRDNARVALFLASDDSEYMSGVVIPATDGGTLSRIAIQLGEGWQDNLVPQD